jgi:putative membrane protein
MKKNHLAAMSFVLAIGLTACGGNDSASTTTTTTDSSSNTATTDNTSTTTSAGDSASGMGAASNATVTGTPFGKADSAFVMKAAIGGLTEVESSRVAQQNAQNARVKAYADMMVNDHSKANDELKALAASRGITLPATLPPDKQKHVEDMKAMQGKNFDKHYVSMMVNDHKKDVAEFEKQAASGQDPDLKAWAAKTLPVLKMHRDSIQAISKSKL